NRAQRRPFPCSAAAWSPRVLRDAALRAAPQDEENLCVTLKAYPHPEEAAKRPSRRAHQPVVRSSAIVMHGAGRHHPARPDRKERAMKFGIFYELQLPRPWQEGGELRLYQNALDQV